MPQSQPYTSPSEYLLTFPEHRDTRGTLVVADSLGEPTLPFLVQRAFWITDVPTHSQRGGHAHRTCHEAVVCAKGRVEITLKGISIKHNSENNISNSDIWEHTFVLDNPHTALHIPPMVWCRLKNFSADCVLLCFASENYDAHGYIHHFDDFKSSLG